MQAADKIACVQRECALNAEHPSEELSFALMHVVYEWANATVNMLFLLCYRC